MSFMWNVAMLIVALVVVRISQWLYRWSNPKCIGKLPPGSMGFPIIGETLDYFKPCGFNEIPPFLEKRILRYGSLFRTNIFMSKTVVSTDPDVNFQIFREENTSFQIGYPDIFVKMFGKENLFFKQGETHKYIKKVTMQILGYDALKQTIIGIMDKALHHHLRLLATQGNFDVKKEVDTYVLGFLTPLLISNLEPETETKVIDDLKAFNLDWLRSFFSLTNLKGLHRLLQRRRDVIKVIKNVLTRRKELREKQEDFLNMMVEEMEKEGSIINQESVVNLIFLLLFTSRETTSSFSALIVKFISQNPKVLVELKREHNAIVENRVDKEGGVRWEEYRHNMSFTNMVINEVLRLTNTSPLLFRKAVKDVVIKGYTIPAGWTVAVAPSVVHYDPAIYENPFSFNPWRWEGKEMIWGSKTFMAFGGGVRLCVGAEFARLQLAMFIHHLVTYYDFSVVQDCEVNRSPFTQFKKALIINISPVSHQVINPAASISE